MFSSAQEAMEWLQERGFATPAQPTFSLPDLGRGSLINIAEWALLAYFQDAHGHQLRIYWLRPKPDREAWQHGQYVIHRFSCKYPQIFPLFLVKRADGCWIVCPHPDQTRKTWTNQPRARLTPDNAALLETLQFDPNLSAEAHWLRVLHAITGERTMSTRVEQAFESFLAELHNVLGEMQNTIKRKVDERSFDEIAALSQEAQQVQGLIQEVERLRRTWQQPYSPDLISAEHPARKRRRRAPRGEITPQSAYTRPLLQALVDLGGRGSVNQVLEKVYEIIGDRLLPQDLEQLPSGQDIRWQCAVKFLCSTLRKQGYIYPDSPRGVWEITDKGRELLRQLLQQDEAR